MHVIKTNLTEFPTEYTKEKHLYFYAKKMIPDSRHSEAFLIIGKWEFGYKFCFNSVFVNINQLEDELEDELLEDEIYNDGIDKRQEKLHFLQLINININEDELLEIDGEIYIESFKDWQYWISIGVWYIEDSQGNKYSLEKFIDFVNSKQNGEPKLTIESWGINFSWSAQDIGCLPSDQEGYWFPSAYHRIKLFE
jgi:hypothetical protein